MSLDPDDLTILRSCLRHCTPRADLARIRRLELAGYLLAGSASFIGNRSFETTAKGRVELGEM